MPHEVGMPHESVYSPSSSWIGSALSIGNHARSRSPAVPTGKFGGKGGC